MGVTAEIAEAAEKRLKKIGHRRTQTHTDNRAGRSKAKGKKFTAETQRAQRKD